MSEYLWVLLSAQSGGGGAGAGGSLTQMLFPILLVVLIFWMLIFRPARQRQKSHDALLASLKSGDKVVTQGGLRGTIAGVTDDVVLLRVADNVKIELNKSAIASHQLEHEPIG